MPKELVVLAELCVILELAVVFRDDDACGDGSLSSILTILYFLLSLPIASFLDLATDSLYVP